jgi:hypothetical protein
MELATLRSRDNARSSCWLADCGSEARGGESVGCGFGNGKASGKVAVICRWEFRLEGRRYRIVTVALES